MARNWKNIAIATVVFTIAAAGVVLESSTGPAHGALLFSRGLPAENLNSSGGDRSNIRWDTGANNQGFYGDDFTIGTAGETYALDKIRTWIVPGLSIGDPGNLGEWFESVTLFTGDGSGSDISPVATTDNFINDSNVTFTQVTYPDGANYNNFGEEVNIWQVDFNNLNWEIAGGEEYRFGVRGVGRQVPGQDFFYPAYIHGSNAALSGSPQEGADDRFLEFDDLGTFLGTVDTLGNGWDKSSDINVQIFGKVVFSPKSVPEPTAGLLTFAIVGIGLLLGQRSHTGE